MPHVHTLTQILAFIFFYNARFAHPPRPPYGSSLLSRRIASHRIHLFIIVRLNDFLSEVKKSNCRQHTARTASTPKTDANCIYYTCVYMYTIE